MFDLLFWILFGSVMIVALPIQLLGLPGTWLIVADAFLLRWLKGPEFMAYQTLVILCFMALLAEALELMTAVKGARTGTPIRGAAAAAIIGALAGGLAGAPVFFGLGAIPGMALGAWLAVFVAALAGGAPFSSASRAATGAMTGRFKGTALKIVVAAAMVAVTIASLVF